MSARSIVAQKLSEGLAEDVLVWPYYKSLDHVLSPTVVVALKSLSPSILANAWYQARVTLIAVVPQQDSPNADDELDALLADVLAVLETDDFQGITWETATRAVLDDIYPSFEIELVLYLQKEDN